MVHVGDRLPDATLRRMTADGIKEVRVAELTKGKKIALFAVPGAFTPTCSDKHLPSFLANAAALKAKGIEAIVCVAVNDPFVLGAWDKATGVDGRIDLLSDGNAELTKALGLEFDGSGAGLGTRSRRYAMVVDDGVVEALLVEDAPGKVEKSSAENLLAVLK